MPRSLAWILLVVFSGCATVHDPGGLDTARRPPARPDRSVADLRTIRPSRTAQRPAYSVLGCVRSAEVDAWERRLAREEAAWRRLLEASRASGTYYRTVRRIVAEEGLPPGLALLPAIESGYRRDARGPTGARGLWQFGAATARRYGLVVSGARDDRVHVERSTRAAMRLLRDLHERYGTWPLALAAYNAGEGRVARALATEGDATFWRLAAARRLPPVTREYVPKFLALVRVMHAVEYCPRLPSPTGVTAAR